MCVASGDGSKQRERRKEKTRREKKEGIVRARCVTGRGQRCNTCCCRFTIIVCVCVWGGGDGDSLVGRYTYRCLPVLRVPPDVSPYV